MFCHNLSNSTSASPFERCSYLQKPITKVTLFVLSVLFAGGALASHFTCLGVPGIVAFSLASMGSCVAFVAACVCASNQSKSHLDRTIAGQVNGKTQKTSDLERTTLPPIKVVLHQAPTIGGPPPISELQKTPQVQKKHDEIAPIEISCVSPYAARASFDTVNADKWIQSVKDLPQFKDVRFEPVITFQGKSTVVFRTNVKNGKTCPSITDVLSQTNLAYKPNAFNPTKITWETKYTAKVRFANTSDKIHWTKQIQHIHPFTMLCFDRDYDNQDRGLILRVGLGHQNEGIVITDVLTEAGFTCEGVPKHYNVKTVLDDLSQEYQIQGHRYKIEKLISNYGCYGDVFLAKDIDTREPVAIKVLRVDKDQEAFEMQKMQKRGGHPNIVRYIGDARLMDKTWIVMEYIEGETMGHVRAHGEWNEDLSAQLLAGEKFMRQCGVHTERENDLQNVLVTTVNGQKVVKLIDFGTLARG